LPQADQEAANQIAALPELQSRQPNSGAEGTQLGQRLLLDPADALARIGLSSRSRTEGRE
jgi:hypothetical protein